MYNFNNYAEKAGIWSFSIPSNYQIGNVGNSGEKTTATHLHLEFQKMKIKIITLFFVIFIII